MPKTTAEDLVIVRPIAPTDSFAQLTTLLHRAYRKQVDMGLTPLAGRQTEDVTRARCASGETFIAVFDARPVGMILLQEKEAAPFPPFFLRPEVAHFSLFAVDPDVQGRGVGQLLLSAVESRARQLACSDLALSMAEPDRELFEYYIRRGFRLVEHWQWPYTNYRSAILSRKINHP